MTTYSFLAEPLRETADRAKKYFEGSLGATGFKCEKEVEADLPLKPTWQAALSDGYLLCVEVRDSPISPTIYEFVAKCAARSLPVKLWVCVPGDASGSEFTRELKHAKELGVGVVQCNDSDRPFEFHRPVPLSLFALKKTAIETVEKKRRQTVKAAQDSFLDGRPDEGCRLICEELEAVTRRFGYHSYRKKWWKTEAKTHGKPSKTLKEAFFATKAWATVLEVLDKRLDGNKARKRCPDFREDLVTGARSFRGWRNALSHKPKTPRARKERDAKLRTMFEATRDLLLEWYPVVRKLKLEI